LIQFGFPIARRRGSFQASAASDGNTGPHMILLHQGIAERGFDAPQRQQCAAFDAEILFDPREQRFVLLQRFLAGDDAPVRDAAIDVLPDLLR